MKLSLLIGGAIGYVLGARAGHERYEQIVRLARRFAGSQTVQSAAGGLQAQIGEIAHKVTGSHGPSDSARQTASPNGATAKG
jgi:hypothetical protein